MFVLFFINKLVLFVVEIVVVDVIEELDFVVLFCEEVSCLYCLI